MRQSFTGMLAIAALAMTTGAVLGCDGGDGDGSGGSGATGTGGQGGGTTSTGGGGGQGGGGGGGGQAAGTGKLDLLLLIDNSRSMADKQEILARAVPDLVGRLVNPPCVGAGGSVNVPGPLDPCPAGYERAFDPVLDMHVGIISSSLGGHGADACQASSATTMSNDDKGRLLARTDPTQSNDLASSTYQGKLFLAWDPGQSLGGQPGVPDPTDGEADLEADSAADLNTTALVPLLAQMVRGVGQIGCGYEATQESWYRFLADPEPYASISVVDGAATPMGTDDTLLQQRRDFLRPSSVLAVVVLSDENDCSIRESGQYFYAAQQTNSNGSRFHLPRARAVCATNPNDPCCLSCGQNQGNCPQDLTCYVNGDPASGTAALTDLEDPPNLRCFDQKRRFGIDLLYPVDRYVKAMTQAMIQNRAGELVANPIFSDLDPSDTDTSIRPPSRVFMAGIVGVPWQDIARDPSDLNSGFKSAAELALPVGAYPSTWDVILGDPATLTAPADPFMIESISPRAGSNPITGALITAPGGSLNEINGSEYATPDQDDLQYACTFALPPGLERDCSVPGTQSCECEVGNPSSNPLCDPATATLQIGAKAYPGIRHLRVLKDLQGQAVVASLCPVQVTDDSQPNYGYRPAMSAIVDAIAPQL